MPAQDHPHVRETSQVQHVRQGVQPELNSQHSHADPPRLPAVRVRVLRQGIPPERQLQEPPANPLR